MQKPGLAQEPETYFSLHLIFGFLVALTCGILFKFIADEVFGTPGIREADAYFGKFVQELSSPAMTFFMVGITFFGDGTTLAFLSFIVGFILFYRGSRRRFYAFAATMSGGGLILVLLKNIFQRARPSFFAHLVGYHGYSFPSGHAMAGMLFFGSLAYVFFFTFEQSNWRRVLSIFFCLLMVLSIGASRIYLGVHYLSDVLAGFAAGLAWMGICMSGTEAWVRLRRRKRSVELS